MVSETDLLNLKWKPTSTGRAAKYSSSAGSYTIEIDENANRTTVWVSVPCATAREEIDYPYDLKTGTGLPVAAELLNKHAEEQQRLPKRFAPQKWDENEDSVQLGYWRIRLEPGIHGYFLRADRKAHSCSVLVSVEGPTYFPVKVADREAAMKEAAVFAARYP